MSGIPQQSDAPDFRSARTDLRLDDIIGQLEAVVSALREVVADDMNREGPSSDPD